MVLWATLIFFSICFSQMMNMPPNYSPSFTPVIYPYPIPKNCFENCSNTCFAKYKYFSDYCFHFECNCPCIPECEKLCLDFGLGPECLAKCGCFSYLAFGPSIELTPPVINPPPTQPSTQTNSQMINPSNPQAMRKNQNNPY